MCLYDLSFLLLADDMLVYQSGLRRVQGTKNEALALHDMFHDMFVYQSGFTIHIR